jgi:hypothetical protein
MSFSWLSVNISSQINRFLKQKKSNFHRLKCPNSGVENDSVVIEIKHNGIPNHGHRIEICRQIRGEERQLFGQQVRAEGVSNIRYRNICLNLSNPGT